MSFNLSLSRVKASPVYYTGEILSAGPKGLLSVLSYPTQRKIQYHPATPSQTLEHVYKQARAKRNQHTTQTPTLTAVVRPVSPSVYVKETDKNQAPTPYQPSMLATHVPCCAVLN